MESRFVSLIRFAAKPRFPSGGEEGKGEEPTDHACMHAKKGLGGGIKQEQKHSSNTHLYIFLYDFSIPEKASILACRFN